MRLSLPSPVDPGATLDVEVDPGLPAGELRRRLALLTGDARWAAPRSPLVVAGVVVDDEHPVGAVPLLPGAHLGDGSEHDGPVHGDPAAAALRAGLHVAVVGGPLAGHVVPLPDRARTRLHLPATTSGRGLGLDVRRHGTRVRARVVDAPWWRGRHRWRPGVERRVGPSTLVVRDTRDSARVPRRWARGLPPWAWTVVASTGGAVVLAVALGQPVLLLSAVTGLVALLGLRTVTGPPRGGEPADAASDPTVPGHDPGTAHPAAGTAPRPAGPAPADVAGLRVATARRRRERDGTVPGDPGPWRAGTTLVLTGPRERVLGEARALVLRTLGAGGTTRLVVRTQRPGDWRWSRWLAPGHHLPPAHDHDVLVVADGGDGDLAAWRRVATGARLLLLVPDHARVPAWARDDVRGPRPGTVAARRQGPGRWRARATRGALDPGRPHETVGADVAEAQARAAAGLAWLRSPSDAPPTGGRRTVTALGSLPGVPGPRAAEVAAAWAVAGPRALPARLGLGADGRPLLLDLVRDGPHALVAGTTGAGKSELLTTLVLGLALTHPPHRLAVLLVDFKGGVGLGPLAGLPHVVDHVHDLDVASARRTLVGLRAELQRRERLLAAAGCADVAQLEAPGGAAPARLLVVVDELRALVDDLPDATATLTRLAAQGRALGVHLVLATQRPAGAVPADLRTNVGLRIALRVADAQDSRDVVGVPDAALLDPDAPGGALVVRGAAPPAPLQVARARHRRTTAPVRLVDEGRGDDPRSRAASGAGAGESRDAPHDDLPDDRSRASWCATRRDDDVAAWVGACRDAARGAPGPGVPWLPALPERLPADTVGVARDASGLLVAVADDPERQRRADVRWQPDHGPLLVLGGPRSGRSTTLLTVGTHALLAGLDVHAVGLPDRDLRHLRVTARTSPGALGSALPLDDVHRVLLLLERLRTARPPRAAPAVLLVDGLDALLDALATHARGAGVDLLTALVRHPVPGVHVAAAGSVVPALSRLLGACALRLVLPVPEPSLDAQAGVPATLAGTRTAPGRAVAGTPRGDHLSQVVLAGTRAASGPPGVGRPVPVRIGRLPERVERPTLGADRAGGGPTRAEVPLGVGGDGPAEIAVDPDVPLVVAGPPGSGRSGTLRTLARGWVEAGHPAWLVSAGTDADPVPGTVHVHPDRAAVVLDGATDGEGTQGVARGVLLVDDVDLLERVDPLLAGRLERLLTPGTTGGLRLVALATTTEHAATGFRGPVGAALRARQVLVLDPDGPAASELLGPGAALHVDPRARPPGRGVLRRGRSLVRVQVHRTTTRADAAATA